VAGGTRRGRRGKRGAKSVSPPPLSPVEQLRTALGTMHEQYEKHRRKRPGKQRHIDDYRELVIKTQTGGFSEALLNLTRETHARRHLLVPEDPTRLVLPAKGGKALGPHAARREAEQAARDLKQEMDRLGVPERAHYYTPMERLETGEIDRTYQLESGPKGRKRGGRR